MLPSANTVVFFTSMLAGASAPLGLAHELSAGEALLTGLGALLATLLVGGLIVSRVRR